MATITQGVPPPEYLKLAAAEKGGTARVAGQDVSFEPVHLDNLGLFSGRARFGDARGAWSLVADAELPHAEAQVTVTRVKADGQKDRFAFLTLWLPDVPGDPVRWEPALTVTAPSGLLLVVDSGVTGAPEDVRAVQRSIDRQGAVPQEVYLNRGWTAFVVPTGAGPGEYPVWKGLNDKGAVTMVVADFRVLDVPVATPPRP